MRSSALNRLQRWWCEITVRIAIDFSHPFAGTQRYMFHCHNLEHEDQGMMMNVAVG